MPATTHCICPARHARGGQPRRQSGVLLLEALVAILIFSLGVLAIVQLQATSIKQSTSAEHRSQAALLANDLIGRMWTSDKTPTTLQASFKSGTTPGAAYTQWLTTVQNSGLPNVSATSHTLPTVSFSSVASGTSGGVASSLATVTIFWQGPGETTPHAYTTVAQIK